MRIRKTSRSIPDHVRATLAVGMGINNMRHAELVDLWGQWGDVVQAEFFEKYGDARKPFVEIIGRAEGWIR